MRVVAYSVHPEEKGVLAQANHKKHNITLIANALSPQTVFYAQGKDAVLVFTYQDMSVELVDLLADVGIKYLLLLSLAPCQVEKNAAARHGMRWANVVLASSVAGSLALERWQEAANQTIQYLDQWQALGQ